MPYLSYQEAEGFYGAELSEQELTEVWQAAAEQVAISAPEPDPLPDDYARSARQAERMLGAWLAAGGHLYTSLGGQASHSATLKQQTAEGILASHMGRYFIGTSGNGWIWHHEPGE